MLTFLVLSLALLPLSQAAMEREFGPEVPSLVVKGQITQNGEPVPALVSLEVLYKLNGNLVPLSLVQSNSLSNYRLYLSGLVFQNKDITYTGILRVQSLSINGGSRAVKLHLRDGKVLYQQDIELNAQDYPEDERLVDDEFGAVEKKGKTVRVPLKLHTRRPHHHQNPVVVPLKLHTRRPLRVGGEEDLLLHRTRRPHNLPLFDFHKIIEDLQKEDPESVTEQPIIPNPDETSTENPTESPIEDPEKVLNPECCG